MHVTLKHKQQVRSAEVRHDGGRYLVTTDGRTYEVEATAIEAGTLRLNVDGRSYRVAIHHSGRERIVGIAGETYTFSPESPAHAAHAVVDIATPEVVAPMPGKILEVLVQPGDKVESGAGLVILEAMKMETRLSAEAAGTVAEVRVSAGDTVDGGQVLIVLTFAE